MSPPEPELHYSTRTDEAGLPQLVGLISRAYGMPAERTERWLRGAGIEHLRWVSEGASGAPIGSLLRLPMGQFFGGRSVTNLGIAGVAVAPEKRGRGIARMLMQGALREARADGFALASLYASTQTLYRKVGFEPAGFCFRYRVQLPSDRPAPNTKDAKAAPRLKVELLTPAQHDEVRQCYSAYARCHGGMLDRGPQLWNRVYELRGQPFDGYGFRNREGQLEAYVFLSQRWLTDALGQVDLYISDVAFLSASAAQEVLTFLFDFGMIARTMELHGGPYHPLLVALPQQRFEVSKYEYWLLRVLDVEKALAMRGYAAGVSAQVALEVTDELLAENRGHFALEVSGGRGAVQRKQLPGAPLLRVSARGLAPIYSGLLSARQAKLAGLADGSDEDLAAFDALFCGPPPAFSDMF